MNETIKTMIKQFCFSGARLQVMTGASNMAYDNDKNAFSFKFKMCKEANYCKLQYDAAWDTYNMYFYKMTKYNFIQTEEYTNIYCDQLQDIFEEYTGLNLSL